MPAIYTSSDTSRFEITNETVNPNTNEVTITYRYNNSAPIVQTLPNPAGPVGLMYHKPSTNIYFVPLVDVQAESEFTGHTYNV